MKPFLRADRVGGQIQKALSDILLKSIKDPRLDNTIISAVKMTSDLRLAYIYYVVHGGDGKSIINAEKGFESALGYIKKNISRQLGLRYMPELKFYYDGSFDYGSKMDSLIKKVKEKD
jgi:ribosome-binding factor A